jgi:hypothetical protein
VSSTSSAMSKLPLGSGLAMSRIPGCVVPGPFGSFVLAGAVVVGSGEVVGEAEGVSTVAGDAGAEGVPPSATGAARGSSGAVW